jgi:hypothetical protein
MRDSALPELLARRWRDALEPGERFLAYRGVEGKLAVARFTLVSADGATHHEFEVAAEAGRDPDRLLDLVTDACDLSIGAWLEEGRPRLTGVPEARQFEGVPVRLTETIRRPGIEAEADRLLAEKEEP